MATQRQILTDRDGTVVVGQVDTEVDAEVKAKIMDAKIANTPRNAQYNRPSAREFPIIIIPGTRSKRTAHF